MLNYKSIEDILNLEGRKILLLIKEDYYKYMNDEKKQLINKLIVSDIVVVNQGKSTNKNNYLAHGGRHLKDNKIHFYPDIRDFKSDEEAINRCKRILPHECFHYFLQPDRINSDSEIEREMLNYYTEGLVEKETRKFCEKHKIDLKKAYYGFNINFVNLVQKRLNIDSNEVIFGEEDYLKNILDFKSKYYKNKKKKKELIDIIGEMAQKFPKNMQKEAFNKMIKIVLQNENIDIIQEKLKDDDTLEL